MKIKLKKEVLEAGGLSSIGSHQGFNKNIWSNLNNGKTVEVDSIPNKSIDKVEEVKETTSSSKKVTTSSSTKGDK